MESNYSDLYFKVADCNFRIHFLDIEDGRKYLPSYYPFYIQDTPKDLIFSLEIGKELVSSDIIGEKMYEFEVFDSKQSIYLTPTGGYKIIIYGFDKQLACAYEANQDFTKCKLSLFGSIENQLYGINNAIMVSYAFSGAYHNLALIHSSVTINNGKGYLFLGKSGTGKSTHSDLWCKYIKGSEILNDDNPVIRIVDNEIRIYGSPWSGKRNYYKQKYVPIGAIVNLKQAKKNHIKQEEKLNAFSILFTSSSSMIWDKKSYSLLCDIISQVVDKIPIYTLENLPEESAALLSYTTCIHKR